MTRLNRRKDAVYAELMEHLEGYGVRLVNFQKLGSRESGELERYFDTEIAPLTSPTTVSRRQPFPFLQNKEIYAMACVAGGGLYWAMLKLGAGLTFTVTAVFIVICLIRFLAVKYHISLPLLKGEEQPSHISRRQREK